MKNVNVIRKLPIKELSILLVRNQNELFISPSGNEYQDYDEAIKDCSNWLNTNCEQTVNNSKNGKNLHF